MGTGCSSEQSASLVQLNKDNIPNYKIVLIGDPGVGKTNILLRYTKNQFDYGYKTTRKPTIENVVKKLNVPVNVVVSVTLWDLPGREDMDLRSTYYKNVDAVLVVVDMSDEASIELATTWRQDFLNKATRTREVSETLPNGITTTRVETVKGFNPRSVPMLLLGNKYDLVEVKIKEEEMAKMLKDSEQNQLEELKEELGEEEEKEKEKNEDKDKKDEPATKKKDVAKPAQNNIDELAELVDRDEGVDSDDDSDDEDRDRLFTPQRGQHAKKNQPECVKKLEQLETEKGFVGSIIVSAKDKDGSVDAAIQSLVRHLLNKSLIIPKQPKKPKEKKKKPKKSKKLRENGLRPLRKCGIPEVDSLFDRSNIVLRRVFEYTTFYQVALHKFKQGCADLGLLTEVKVSLEDCIVAVRDMVKQGMHRELTLVEEDGFVGLHYDVDEEEDKMLLKQLRGFIKLLQDFNEEYCALCKAILRESGSLEALLDKLDSRISARAEEMWEDAEAGRQEKGVVARVCDVCEKNRARLAHARLQVEDNMKTVETAREKIKAALMW